MNVTVSNTLILWNINVDLIMTMIRVLLRRIYNIPLIPQKKLGDSFSYQATYLQ